MKHYDIQKTEEKIRKFWEKQKIYKFDFKKKGKCYSIDTPPPTVSGDMHMGHAFSYSQQDFIARYRRMKEGVFYPFGTDDNGLPTEKLVEKLNNVKSKEMSRKDFIDLCLRTLMKITPEFVQDWKNLGISSDYDISYSTIDKNSQKISQKSFIELFKAGRIYKKGFPTIWCPECQTAIAQAELEDKELLSQFSTIKFECEGEVLPIATTRPELIPACVAIFVNPGDKKHNLLTGKKAKVPLFDYEVPIIADKSADIKKGTGIMMVCSYGDKFDVDAINRYKLEPKIIFNYDGTLKIEKYKGMKIKEARKKILEDLKKEGLVLDSKSISHIVNVHDRCGTEIEFLPTDQWFIKILNKKKELLAQGKKIKWYPKHMCKRYENWVRGLEWDWSISRDRHFGIPIPVWECVDCGQIILPEIKELPVDPLETKKKCPKCEKFAEPETRVLDTWATSSLTPQITSSLIGNKIKIPYSLRPQGHDIIRTWAFYTIVKSYFSEKKIPWNDIMVSGFVTLGGQKMSKSKGIVINPKEIMKKYGADAMRFWAAGSRLGEDMDYQEKELIAGKRFINKLFNASKFVFAAVGKNKPKKPKKLEPLDELFLKVLNNYIFTVTSHFEEYEYSRAKFNVDKFFWKDFCDNYLEIVKKRIYQGKGNKKLSAQYTLYNSFLAILKMIAPIMPFITEEIYQEYFKKFERKKSVHLTSWPEHTRTKKDKGDWDIIIKNLSLDRQAKTEKQIQLSLTSGAVTLPTGEYQIIKNYEEDFLNVSGGAYIRAGKEFKVEFPSAGTEPILDKKKKKTKWQK